MSKTITQTWTYTYTPIISKQQVEKITKKATRREKLRLLFRPSQYTFDNDAIIRYKEMDGKLFVMKRGTKL